MARTIQLTERQRRNFEAKIDRSGSCHIWTASKRKGYGQFGLGWKVTPICAHILSYILNRGPIPEGMLVCHRCDNPACVNPEHLFLGTYSDNMQDCSNKNRLPKGVSHFYAKVDADSVREIRSRYSNGGTSLKKLGREFGLCAQTVHEIVRREIWKHVN